VAKVVEDTGLKTTEYKTVVNKRNIYLLTNGSVEKHDPSKYYKMLLFNMVCEYLELQRPQVA
jgi:hypothetical protein